MNASEKGVNITEMVLEAEQLSCKREQKKDEPLKYNKSSYSVSSLNDNVVRMETGLPTKDVIDIVVQYTARCKDSIVYYAGWRIDCITLLDQLFMKLKQNCTNLHLAE